jgi:thiamine biosynthesis lipoprotein
MRRTFAPPRPPASLAAVAVLLVAAPAAQAGGPPALAAVREYVMGTIAEVRVYAAPSPARAETAAAAALEEIRALDRLMAVQRPESDVSRLNRQGARGPVAVDARVVEVLEASLAASRLTGGAFDVTVLPVVRAWGFTDGHPQRPAPDRAAPAIAGFRRIVLDRAAHTVTLESPDAALDLGGIAKGYALDRARGILLASGVRSAYLDLGGEIATLGSPPDAPHWRIGIRHPRRPDALLGVVEIGEAAVATSGDGEQYVGTGPERVGHIFDPLTGRPAGALLGATVVAASATLADALSTAAIVLGAEQMAQLLPGVNAGGLFAAPSTGEQPVVTHTAGLVFHPIPCATDVAAVHGQEECRGRGSMRARLRWR